MKFSILFRLSVLLLLALVFLVGPSPLLILAHAAATAPETVAQAVSENTKITWAWGEAAQAVSQAALTVLSMVALYFFRKLPENIVALIGNARVELLLSNARLFALNAVKDASVNKELSIDVGNKVVAEALTYALNNGSSWLIGWAGGADGIAAKVWARLKLEPTADASALPKIVASAVAANSKAA